MKGDHYRLVDISEIFTVYAGILALFNGIVDFKIFGNGLSCNDILLLTP